MVLALYWSMTSPDEPPPNEPLWTPNMPCSRWTTNPDSATTATSVRTSQYRLKRPDRPLRLAGRRVAELPSLLAESGGVNGSVLGSVVVMGAFLTSDERCSPN